MKDEVVRNETMTFNKIWLKGKNSKTSETGGYCYS